MLVCCLSRKASVKREVKVTVIEVIVLTETAARLYLTKAYIVRLRFTARVFS